MPSVIGHAEVRRTGQGRGSRAVWRDHHLRRVPVPCRRWPPSSRPADARFGPSGQEGKKKCPVPAGPRWP